MNSMVDFWLEYFGILESFFKFVWVHFVANPELWAGLTIIFLVLGGIISLSMLAVNFMVWLNRNNKDDGGW